MPLTEFQRGLLAVLGPARTPDSYLAGDTALHFEPNFTRIGHDLDLFHDAVERVAEAFEQDRGLLEAEGHAEEPVLRKPGFIRTIVSRGGGTTQIDRAHDAAWRFMSVAKDPGFTPLSLLQHRRRRGRDRPEEVARLDTVEPFDVEAAKERWLTALDEAESWARSRPLDEMRYVCDSFDG